MLIFALCLFLSLLLFVLWWLLIETEGVYLGRGIVIWLYDLYAGRYDGIKDYEPEYEFMLLAVPIMSAITPHGSPLVLDVATGTGRLPIALLSHSHFQGQVVGVDLSRRMLRKGAEKLSEYQDQVEFIHAPAETLPFDDDTFDVVTCLESLEFMRDPAGVIAEMVRVLRPGGLMLVTNRVNTRWMPGQTFADSAFVGLLCRAGLVNVETEPWQEDYHRVWASKPGESPVTGPRPLSEIVCCPCCGGHFSVEWHCLSCSHELQVGLDGVAEWFALAKSASCAAPTISTAH